MDETKAVVNRQTQTGKSTHIQLPAGGPVCFFASLYCFCPRSSSFPVNQHRRVLHSGQPVLEDAAAPDFAQPPVPSLPHGAPLARDNPADAPRLAPGGPRGNLPPDALLHGQALHERRHGRPHHEP